MPRWLLAQRKRCPISQGTDARRARRKVARRDISTVHLRRQVVCAEPHLLLPKADRQGVPNRHSMGRLSKVRYQGTKLGVSMEQSLQTKQEGLFESFRALVAEENLRSEQRRCVRCGAAMQYVDVTFWLHETDLGCNARLPFCLCEETSPSPVRNPARNAA